jgi:hypothetical protein
VLRYGREAHVESGRYIAGRELAAPHEVKDGPPAWLGDDLQSVQLAPIDVSGTIFKS